MCECGNTNFAFRGRCNRCQAPRPGGAPGGAGGGGKVSKRPPLIQTPLVKCQGHALVCLLCLVSMPIIALQIVDKT